MQLKFYRLQKINEGRIALNVGEAEALYGPDEVGSRRSHDEQVPLSTLIQVLNERFGTDFKPADQLFFDQIEAEAVDREEIRQAARVNTIDDFRLVFERELDGLFIDRMEGNDDIFRRVMEDEKFRSVAAAYLIEKVYHQVRRESVTPAS